MSLKLSGDMVFEKSALIDFTCSHCKRSRAQENTIMVAKEKFTPRTRDSNEMRKGKCGPIRTLCNCEAF